MAGQTIEFQSGADWDAFWVKGDGARLVKEKGIKGEVLTLPVGSFPDGASPYGIQTLPQRRRVGAGLVQSELLPTAPLSDPTGLERGAIKSMRGGSWLKPAVSLRTSDRDWGIMDSRPSGTGFDAPKTISNGGFFIQAKPLVILHSRPARVC